MAAIILCNYTSSEQNALKFLLRNFPGISIVPVEREQLGLTVKQLLEGSGEKAGGPAFSEHMAVFCGVQGPLLSHLIDLTAQAYRDKGYRAVMTETNQNWTLPELKKELQAEEEQLKGRQ